MLRFCGAGGAEFDVGAGVELDDPSPQAVTSVSSDTVASRFDILVFIFFLSLLARARLTVLEIKFLRRLPSKP